MPGAKTPQRAGPGLPYLDLGNTLPNFPVPVLAKTSTRVVDAAPTGPSLGIGDTLKYTLTLDNRSLFSLSAIGILDTLPTSHVRYVANSTTRDAVAVPDSVSGTPFPLDVDGLFVPILQSKQFTVIEFRVTITATGTAVNTAQVVGAPGVEASNTVVIPTGGSFTTCTIKLTNSSGTEVDYAIGDVVYVTVTDADTNTNASTAETLTAVVQNNATLDTELITLTETGVNTGIFRNTSALPSSSSTGLGPNDGTLNVAAGTTINASRLDPVFGDTCADTATITATSGLSKQLYLDTDGTDGDVAGDLDRVSPAQDSPADGTTSKSIALATQVSAVIATGTTTQYEATTTSHSFNHTINTGTNRMLVVTMAVGSTVQAGTAGTVSTPPTFAGTAMTQVGTAFSGSGGRVYIFTLKDDSATSYVMPTTGSIVFTSSANSRVQAGATTFTGVNQTTPYGAFVPSTSTGSNPISIAVASAVGQLVVAVGAADEEATNQTITPSTAGSQVELWDQSSNDYVSAGASTKPGAAGDVTLTFALGVSEDWEADGISIRPAITTNGSATFTQAPSFAEAFSLTGAPSVTAYYTVTSGTMLGSPSISAVLRKNGSTFATSNSVSASATTGSGVFTFGFPSTPTSFISTDVISLVITNNQTGVAFTVDYDSSTKPSAITLPTNTVIHADTVAVYDAAYPGGSVVTTPTVGQTLYVRATVGDPFGAYDVTSANLVIDGIASSAGDIASTAMTEVASAGATKTYQYIWVTGSTQDTFNLTVTAKEGFENTITSTKSTSVPLTARDLGTPSITEFTTGNNGPHTLTYAGGETIYVRVTDLDQNINSGAVETLTVTIFRTH